MLLWFRFRFREKIVADLHTPLPLLKRIATAVVLIPIVLALTLRAPVWVVAAVVAMVALLTIHEFLKLTESYGVAPMRWPLYIFTGLFFLLLAISAGSDAPLLSTGEFLTGMGFAAALAPFLFLTIAMRRADLRSGYPAAAAAAFGFAYIALPMAMLVQLRQQWAGAFYLLYLLLVVWAGDIFAYFVGKSIGRHLMAPRISPKKTWEGAAASLVASVGGGMGALRSRGTDQFSAAACRPDHAARRPVRPGAAGDRSNHSSDDRSERRSTTRGLGRIPHQARRGSERFRHDPPRPRRHARPHRRPALRRAGAVGLRRLARDAVIASHKL